MNSTRSLSSTSIAVVAALTATSALAGGVTPPPPPPVIVPVEPDYDWSGFYAGAFAATSTGIMNYSTGGPDYDVNGEGYGLFAGYNMQNGNLVYGGEISYLSSAGVVDLFPFEDYTNVLDIRARVGYAIDRLLLNGFVGYSMATAEQLPAARPDWDVSGVVYGVGADFAVTDSIFAGLTLEHRLWEGDAEASQAGLGTQSYNPTTLTLRIGYRF